MRGYRAARSANPPRTDPHTSGVNQTLVRPPGCIGSIGAVRSNAWICDFSSMHKTVAFSGGARSPESWKQNLKRSRYSVADRIYQLTGPFPPPDPAI